MSGVRVMRYLAANTSAITALVPAASIRAGRIPIGAPLPNIEIEGDGSVPRTTIAMTEPGRMHADRVRLRGVVEAATSGGGSYASLDAIMKAVARIPNQRGTINGVSVDSVIVDIEGPDDPEDETGRLSRTRDYVVRWKET